LEFSLMRDEIPQHSIPYTFFSRPKIGYIRIESFTETTDEEIGKT
jgi:C-terminal processing protease CtpA/Prc